MCLYWNRNKTQVWQVQDLSSWEKKKKSKQTKSGKSIIC